MSYILAETSTLLLMLLNAGIDVSNKCWLMYRRETSYILAETSLLARVDNIMFL